jgi:hypothetical protein
MDEAYLRGVIFTFSLTPAGILNFYFLLLPFYFIFCPLSLPAGHRITNNSPIRRRICTEYRDGLE